MPTNPVAATKRHHERIERIEQLTRERDSWQRDAEQQIENTQFYRGLVVQIGELFGEAAHTRDDGSIDESVLCLKVPELVKRLHSQAGTGTPPNTVSVPFACEPIEQHPLEEFQETGHFVCAMVDEHGHRREWQGDQVYVLKLLYKGEQVLRIMADSEAEANRLMTAAIRDTFFANWTAQFIVGFNHTEWTKLNDRRNQLAEWLKWRGFTPRSGNTDIFDTAVRYLRSIREVPTDKPSEWIPQEWRG